MRTDPIGTQHALKKLSKWGHLWWRCPLIRKLTVYSNGKEVSCLLI